MAVAWSTYVNTKAYGFEGGYQDNYTETTFESGKTRRWLKNSAPKKTGSFCLALADDGSATSEFAFFLYWYENTCLSGAKSFYFPDLQTHTTTKEYRFTAVPTWEGQDIKEVTLSVEEM